MFRIEAIELHGIGPFQELTLEFPEKKQGSDLAELHVLTGQNGTGKTTILYALAATMDLRRQELLASRWRDATSWGATGRDEWQRLIAALLDGGEEVSVIADREQRQVDRLLGGSQASP